MKAVQVRELTLTLPSAKLRGEASQVRNLPETEIAALTVT